MLESVAHYKILERVGPSALGDVYRARDTRLGRTVAVTMVADAIAGDPAGRSRFLEAAERAMSVSHPNIAALYEAGEEQGAIFLASEFVAGQTLGTMTTGHPLHPRRAIDFAMQIADALADAHAAGVAHGAIRADRIIVTSKGNVKIPDFGFGPWIDPQAAHDETADLWALGVIFYQMLTGHAPRAGWPAPAPSSTNRNLARELDVISGKLLALDRQQRYQSAAIVAAELQAAAAILDVRAGASEPPVLAIGKPRRSNVLWIAVALAALVLVGALIWAAMRM